jgi:hypothetical protein
MNFNKKCLLVAVSILSISTSAFAQDRDSQNEKVTAYLKIVTQPNSAGEMRTKFEMCQVNSTVSADNVKCATIGNQDGYTPSEIEMAENQLQRKIYRNIAIRAAGTIVGIVAGGALGYSSVRSIPSYSGSLNIVQEFAQALVIGVGGGVGGAAGLGVGVLVADSLGNLEVQSASRDALTDSQGEGRALVIVDQADGRLNEVVHTITTVLMSIELKESLLK